MIPDSEVRWCAYPKPQRDTGKAAQYGTGCFWQHPGAVIWNGAEWFCTEHDTTAVGFIPRSFYGDAPHDPEFEIWGIPYAVSRRDFRDQYYSEATAPYRRAAASNSPFGRLRAEVDRWREDVPGGRDWTGQVARRTRC